MKNNAINSTLEAEDMSWLISLFDDAESAPAPIKTAPIKTATAPSKTCNRCNGSGRLSYYSHNKGGVCFRCNGSGK